MALQGFLTLFDLTGLKFEAIRQQSSRNGRSQAAVRREVRRRSNLPKAVQRRLGFKCH